MSINFGNVKKHFEHFGNQVKHHVEHKAHDIEHKVHEVEHKAEHAAHKVQDTLDPQKLLEKIQREAQHLFDKVEMEFKHAEEQAENELKHTGNIIELKVEHAITSVRTEFEDLEHKAIQAAKDEAMAIWKGIKGEIRHIGHWLEHQAIVESLKILKHAYSLLKTVTPDAIHIEIGGVRIYFDHLHNTMDIVVHNIHHPPTGKDQIAAMIYELSPNRILIDEKVAAALLIEVSILSGAGGLTIEKEKVRDGIAEILHVAEAIQRGDKTELVNQLEDIAKQGVYILEDKAEDKGKEILEKGAAKIKETLSKSKNE